MFNRTQTPRPKPLCPVCQAIRRTLFLIIGLGIFAYYAFSPELRRNDSFANLLEYLTIANVSIAMLVGITAKLSFGLVKHFRQK